MSRIDIIGQNGNDGLHYKQNSFFHDQAEFLIAADSIFPTENTTVLALALAQVDEEIEEWKEEQCYGSKEDIKEALDVMYTIAQYLNFVLGPDKAKACWDALHKNNMSKCQNGKVVKNESGKVMKPKGYEKLDLSYYLKKDCLC